jgi:hypothetical protein
MSDIRHSNFLQLTFEHQHPQNLLVYAIGHLEDVLPTVISEFH